MVGIVLGLLMTGRVEGRGRVGMTGVSEKKVSISRMIDDRRRVAGGGEGGLGFGLGVEIGHWVGVGVGVGLR